MYNFSNYIGETKNVNINMRHELGLLEDSFHINILYIRNNKYVRCDCFNDLEKTAGNPECPKCFGMGYFASIQKARCIESSNGTAYSRFNKMVPKLLGVSEQNDEVYYFEYDIAPKPRDFILKVSWKDGKPVDVLKVMEIINVYEMRGDNGRVEAYGAGIGNRPDEVLKFNQMLHRLPNKAKHILEKGNKYLWPLAILSQNNEKS